MSDEAQPDGTPSQSAFFRATEASRYARQAEIRAYEDSTAEARYANETTIMLLLDS